MATIRISNAVEEIILTKDNSPGYRRSMGVEPKDRKKVHVSIEKVFLEALDTDNRRRGDLSDLVNQGLNLILVQMGLI